MLDPGSHTESHHKSTGLDKPLLLSQDAPVKLRFATAKHLVALGVGSVVSGYFFGWQSALVGGLLGLGIAVIPTFIMYTILVLSISELSTMIPKIGGPYVFALEAFGRRAGYFAGLAEAFKVAVTCQVGIIGITGYIAELTGTSEDFAPLYWVAFNCIFVLLNVVGVELSFKVQVFFTLSSILLLAIFYTAAIPSVNMSQWVDDWILPGGYYGVIQAIPFTLWFFLGIEELPLTITNTIDPNINMPRGIMYSFIIIICLSFCTVFFSCSISPGAFAISQSTSPLLEGYKSVFGDNIYVSVFGWCLITGILSSTHSFFLVQGHLLHALGADGIFPSILARIHPKYGTPYVALIGGSCFGLVVSLSLYVTCSSGSIGKLGTILINTALIGALSSYIFQLSSFISLRLKDPHRYRPYSSPFGVPGAAFAIVIALSTLSCMIYVGVQDPLFNFSLLFATGFLILGCIYYVVF